MFEDILDLVLPFILIIAGVIGLLYGIDKLRKGKESESDLLKYLALATSIVIGLVNIWAIYEWLIDTVEPDVTMVHWLTVLLIFLAGSSMLAEPLKDTPLAAIIALLAFGAITGLLLLFYGQDIVTGDINIPLWFIILLIVGVVAVIFIITWFTEFTVDRVLQIISWAPIVIILSGILTIQGLLVVALQDAGGIWALLVPSS